MSEGWQALGVGPQRKVKKVHMRFDTHKLGYPLTALATLALIASTAAQQPQGGAAPAQGRGGQMPRGAQPINFEDRTGFQPIFDGTMKNWDGDPAIWKAEGNVLVGTTTAENPLKENTFVIWRGGEPADFELKVEYRMSATNSGSNFAASTSRKARSQPARAIAGKWVLKGYQADIDFANQFTRDDLRGTGTRLPDAAWPGHRDRP